MMIGGVATRVMRSAVRRAMRGMMTKIMRRVMKRVMILDRMMKISSFKVLVVKNESVLKGGGSARMLTKMTGKTTPHPWRGILRQYYTKMMSNVSTDYRDTISYAFKAN